MIKHPRPFAGIFKDYFLLVPVMVNRTIFGTNCSDFFYFHLQQINSHENKRLVSQQKLGKIVHVGAVLKTSGPAVLKYVPGFENWPRFVEVIEQKKILSSSAPAHFCSNL